MFISQTIEDELKELIELKNWSMCLKKSCDKSSYKTDKAFKANYHNKLYNEISTNTLELIDNVLEPFRRNNYHVELTTTSMTNYWWFHKDTTDILCKLEYSIKYDTNPETNPFSAEIEISVKKHNSHINYEWYLKNPSRIYFKRYLKSGIGICCNQKLFTSRGFIYDYCQHYKWDSNKSILEWSKIEGVGDSIIQHLHKTVSKIKTNQEKIRKEVNIRKKEKDIQKDSVFCMLSEINSKIKHANIKMLFDGECVFDYVDSPIKFDLTLTNHPEQDDEDLKIKSNISHIFEPSRKIDNPGKKSLDHIIKLYSYGFSEQHYYNSPYQINLTYKPNETKPWNLVIDDWCIPESVFYRLFKCGCIETFSTLDEVRDYIVNIIIKDIKLYEKMEQCIDEL